MSGPGDYASVRRVVFQVFWLQSMHSSSTIWLSNNLGSCQERPVKKVYAEGWPPLFGVEGLP